MLFSSEITCTEVFCKCQQEREVKREKERDRETERDTDRQTDRQTKRERESLHTSLSCLYVYKLLML